MIVAIEPIDNGYSGNVWACNGDRASAVASTGRRLRNHPERRAALRYVEARHCDCVHLWTGCPCAAGDKCGRYMLDRLGRPHNVRCINRLQLCDSVIVRGKEGAFRVVEVYGTVTEVAATGGVSRTFDTADVLPEEACFA